MKVLVASNLYPPFGKSGGVDVAVSTVQGLQELGHTPIVLTAGPWQGLRSLWPVARVENDVKMYRFYPLNIYYIKNAANYSTPIRVIWNILDTFNVHSALYARWVISQEEISTVISHNLKGLGYLLPRVFARASKHVHVLHDVQLVEPSGQLFPKTVQERTNRIDIKIYSVVTRWLFGFVKYIVSPSRFLLDFYQQRNFFRQAKTEIMSNPIQAVLAQPSVHEGIKIVMFTPSKFKGVEDMLEAWQGIEGKDVHLEIIGEGDFVEEVKKSAEMDSRIRWRNYPTSKEENERIFAQTDILVMPSRCLENSPTAIAQAIAHGLRVITTDVGGAPELVEGYEGAMIVPPSQPQSLAEALIKTIKLSHEQGRVTPKPGLSPSGYARALLRLDS